MKFKCSFISAVLLLLLAAMSGRGQFEYTTNADNGITITGYDGSGGPVSIPSTITGLPVTDIAGGAFFFDQGITSVTIPGSVITIEDEAFYACSELAEVTISNGVANIGACAFEYSPFTNLFIPASTTNMGPGPFEWCSELTTITVDPQNAFFTSVDGIVFDKSKTVLVQYPNGLNGPYAVPSNVTVIEPNAFAANTNLTGVTIPESVTNMGQEAFSGCAGLANVSIEGATSIGPFAFYLCTNLTSITIPGSLTNIGPYAFQYSGLTNITITTGPTAIDDDAFIGCIHLTSVTIPASVTNIGQYAFSGCLQLTNVTIPSSVVSISDGAFYSCPLLTTLVIPTSVTSMGDYALSHTGLKSVTIPSSVTNMETFNGYAFADDPLTNVTIVDGVPDIDPWTFYHCLDLTNVTIPGSVNSIEVGAFNYCTNLAEVTIGHGVVNIGDGAFNGCFNLGSITVPDTVTSIGEGAFAGCLSLTNAAIFGNITNLGESAFDQCIDLKMIYFSGNAPGVDVSVFSGDTNATAYYLPGTTGWDAFATNAGIPIVLWNPAIESADSNFGVRNGRFGFDIAGTSNIPIVIEACTNLANPAWVPLQSLTLTNGLFYFSDAQSSKYPTRYYRISLP
jgi:BspA type Leucine rich repeat region (6 copies)